ncbi:MAG: hypothetical protein ACK51F_20565 [Rhodospirillales bacterium]|jgi:hypothetical protein
MLNAVYRYFFPPPIRDRASLAGFMSGEAAYLAQRSTYEFTRNTLAWHGQSAFGDTAFNDAFRICRWEAFASVLAGFSVLAFVRLDPGPGGRRDDLEAALVRLYAQMLGAYETPRHRTDWNDDLTDLAARLRALVPGEAPSAADVVRPAAARVYKTLPARAGNPREEKDVISNALRFGTIGFSERLENRLRPAEATASLLAG